MPPGRAGNTSAWSTCGRRVPARWQSLGNLVSAALCADANGCAWCPVVPEEQILQRVSKNFARKLQKNRKRLATTKGATFATVSTLPELEEAYQEFLQAEAASWKGEQGSRTAILMDPRMKLFCEQVMRRFAKRGRCEIHLLRLDGRPIAGQYTLMTDDTVYVLKIGYDQAFAHLSPGVVLLDYLFRRSASNPAVKRIDFTTDMPWMTGWQPSREDVFNLFLFRRTLRGQIGAGLLVDRRDHRAPSPHLGRAALPATGRHSRPALP